MSKALVTQGVINCDPAARGFSLATSYYLAMASYYAYAEECGDWVKWLGLGSSATFFTRGQFHGLVGLRGTVPLLAFRGTQGVGNYLTDAQMPLIECPPYPGRVHLGFAEAVESVWPEVLRLLGDPAACPPVWLTGHSLGGAMATLASVRLAHEGYAIRAVYTFGAPRAGNRAFREAYALNHYRFVNDNDLVPHLPFRWCYKHVGELKLLNHAGCLIEERTAWRAKKRALRRTVKRVARTHRSRHRAHDQVEFEFDWLDDHRLDRYLQGIQAVLSQMAVECQEEMPAARGVSLDSLGIDTRHHGISVDTLRIDAAHDGVASRHRPKPITEAQLAAAFLEQTRETKIA